MGRAVTPLRRGMALILRSGGLALLMSIHPPGILACQSHNCDPYFACIDASGLMKFVSQASDCTPTTQGDTPIPGYTASVFADGDLLTWDTSFLGGPWLDDPGGRTYIINFPQELSRALASSQVQVNTFALLSADNPVEAGVPHMNFIDGAAYLAEFSNVTSNQLTVLNGSCAHYFLRIEVQAQVAQGVGDAGSVD
jgi:hypothetical protein